MGLAKGVKTRRRDPGEGGDRVIGNHPGRLVRYHGLWIGESFSWERADRGDPIVPVPLLPVGDEGDIEQGVVIEGHWCTGARSRPSLTMAFSKNGDHNPGNASVGAEPGIVARIFVASSLRSMAAVRNANAWAANRVGSGGSAAAAAPTPKMNPIVIPTKLGPNPRLTP